MNNYHRRHYEDFANAIIIQAANDWRAAQRTLRNRPLYPTSTQARRLLVAEQTAEECERFFLSEWMTILTRVDGSYLLRKLREEAAEQAAEKAKQNAGRRNSLRP